MQAVGSDTRDAPGDDTLFGAGTSAHLGVKKATTGQRERYGGVTVLAVIAVLVVLPAIAEHIGQSRPLLLPAPAYDRFLRTVRMRTPPTARLLVASTTPAFALYRANYELYPRTLYSAHGTALVWVEPHITWEGLARLARRTGARYILVWKLPAVSGGMIIARDGDGLLAAVNP